MKNGEIAHYKHFLYFSQWLQAFVAAAGMYRRVRVSHRCYMFVVLLQVNYSSQEQTTEKERAINGILTEEAVSL